MKKQILSLAVVSTLSLGSLLSPNFADHVSANSLNDLKNEQQRIDQERSGINNEINQKKSKISELQNEQQDVQAEIKRLDMAMEDVQNKLEEKNAEIKRTQEEIEQLKKDIVVLEDRIEKRNELLKDRARSLQLSGGAVSYIDVLLGAQSFSDFVDRMGAVATIANADKELLEQHQKDKDELEAKKKEVEAKLSSLEKMKAELEQLKKQLDGQIAEKNKLMKSLKKEEEEFHAAVTEDEVKAEFLANQQAAIQKAIQLEEARIAEEKRQEAIRAAEEARRAEEARQAEAERQKAAASAAKSNNNSNNAVSAASAPAPKPAPAPAKKPAVSNSAFTWPAAGRVSSGFGSRSLGQHYGIDIAQPGPNVPIVAAAGGVVSRSDYSSSYGNVIYISHSINGQVYTTVYAHLSSRAVGVGSVVSKGQRIGTMGNTGQSYGQHLHFELHKGPWTASKGNAVNPMPYLP
ncbi:peptidase M23 [Mesobacillus campisalis]|uniref:Peptidase M23 n=1 Tax=Mesobacillus campisalis TaxID=1408103 RepID=A0A0M2SZ65_9BACI|nr:peptidoglycan DD-metalloendopeptidase family protein [Mesobacillus campisalis]KKK39458.1 peptidase M23 [Mesobacillus campisalis]